MFGKYSYIVYMLIFTLIPITIIVYKKHEILKKNLKIVFTTVLLAIIYQLIADPFAEAWKAWFFTKDKILDIWIFNFPLENMVFIVLVSIAISTATIGFTESMAKRTREK